MNTDAPSDLENILVKIASIGPTADRDTLVLNIDQSIEAVIEALLAEEDPKSPAPDLIKTTQVTLEFLEACANTDDEEFRDHISMRAKELLAVVTTGKRIEPEPEPIDPAYEVHHDDFARAFSDYFCEYIHSLLAEFHIEVDKEQPAFILRPDFTDRFVKAVRKYVLPDMLANRRIRNMADSITESNYHKAHFFGEFNKPEEENIVQLIWSNIVGGFGKDLKSGGANPAVDSKNTKEKKGGLLGGLKKKKEKPAKAAKSSAVSNDKASGFWAALQKGAENDEYDTPKLEDFAIFSVLMDYRLDIITENKDAVRQLLEQEMGVDDEEMEREGREGATRDWLYKMVPSLPPHLGELLILWCFHTFNDLFKPSIAKSFLAGQGTSEDARARAVPYFFRWFKQEPDQEL